MTNVRQRQGHNPYARRDADALAQRIGAYSKKVRVGSTTLLKDGLFPETSVSQDEPRFFINGHRYNQAVLQDTSSHTFNERDGPYIPASFFTGELLHVGPRGPRYMEQSFLYDTDFNRYDEWYRPGYLDHANFVPSVYVDGRLRWFDHYQSLSITGTQHYHCGVITFKQALAFHEGIQLRDYPAFSYATSAGYVQAAVSTGVAVEIQHDVWAFQYRWFRTFGGSNYAITDTFVNDFPMWTLPQHVFDGSSVLSFVARVSADNTFERSRRNHWANINEVADNEDNNEIRSAQCPAPYAYTSDPETNTTIGRYLPLPDEIAGAPGSNGNGAYAPAWAEHLGNGRIVAFYGNVDAHADTPGAGGIIRYETNDSGGTWQVSDVTEQFFDVSVSNTLGSKIGRFHREEATGYVMDYIQAFVNFSLPVSFANNRLAVVAVLDYDENPGGVGFRETTLHVSTDAGLTFTKQIVPFLNIPGGVTFDPSITASSNPAYTQAQFRFYHPIWAVSTGENSAVVLMQNAAVTFPQLAADKRVYFLVTSDGFETFQQVIPNGLPYGMYRWLGKIQVDDDGSWLITGYNETAKDLVILRSTNSGADWTIVEEIYVGFSIGGNNNTFYDIFMQRGWDWYPLLSVPRNRLPWYLNGSIFSNPVYGTIEPTPDVADEDS